MTLFLIRNSLFPSSDWYRSNSTPRTHSSSLRRCRVFFVQRWRFRPRRVAVDEHRTAASRSAFQEVSETQDAVIVIGLDDQLREHAGQLGQRLAAQDHRLGPDRLSLQRFEIWIFDRLARIYEARRTVKRSSVKRLHAQVREDCARVEARRARNPRVPGREA